MGRSCRNSGQKMKGNGAEDAGPPAESSCPPPLEWKFSQVFGERIAGEEVQEGTPFASPLSDRFLMVLDELSVALAFCFLLKLTIFRFTWLLIELILRYRKYLVWGLLEKNAAWLMCTAVALPLCVGKNGICYFFLKYNIVLLLVGSEYFILCAGFRFLAIII